jgi:kynurenine formamidase
LLPRLRGADSVERGKPVQAWDLVDCAAAQGVESRAGDAVLVRSGAAPYWAAHPDEHGTTGGPGLRASVLEFLFETDAALLGWDQLDAATEDQGIPNPMAIPTPVHVHQIALSYMGMPLLDNCDLEALAAECARLGRWEFQLVIAPLVIEGGTGSPVNPIALF